MKQYKNTEHKEKKEKHKKQKTNLRGIVRKYKTIN